MPKYIKRSRRGGQGSAQRGRKLMERPTIEEEPSLGARVSLMDLPRVKAIEVPRTPRKKRHLPSPDLCIPSAASTETDIAGSMSPPQSSPKSDMDIKEATSGDDEGHSESEYEELGGIYMPRSRKLIFEDEDEDRANSAPISAKVNMDWEPVGPNVNPEIHEPTDSDPLGPEKFSFCWKRFEAVQESPLNRREMFIDVGCGPTVRTVTPYNAFTQIWDRQFVEHIVNETNKYAQQYADWLMQQGTLRPNSRITRWRDTTVDEMYRFFAVLLAMGMVVKSQLSDYWSAEDSVIRTPGFAKVISLNRFKLLLKCLHFTDLSNVSASKSKLIRIQPILDHLNTKFQSLYIPSRNLALDESLTLYKGWLSIKQYIGNKSAGVGIKTYEVCESSTGYMYKFEVHAGPYQTTGNGPLSGFVPTLVLRLLDGLEHRGHTIWMDNFYNSPALARELKTRGFDCVGTLRSNSQFVPLELANLNLTDMAPGEVRGCTSGDVDLVVWRDKRKVCLISTYHGCATVMDDQTQSLKPNIVPDYNVCMGGVDSKDQMLAAYPVERTRQRIWYKKLFRRLLNTSVLNAFIIYKHHTPISHRRFREELILRILEIHKPIPPTPPTPHIAAPSVYCLPARYECGSSGSQRIRRQCKICKEKKVDTYCKTCNFSVCIFAPCWVQHMLNSGNGY